MKANLSSSFENKQIPLVWISSDQRKYLSNGRNNVKSHASTVDSSTHMLRTDNLTKQLA